MTSVPVPCPLKASEIVTSGVTVEAGAAFDVRMAWALSQCIAWMDADHRRSGLLDAICEDEKALLVEWRGGSTD